MNKNTYTITCEYCKKPFETTVYYARFCCESHRQMGYQKRKKEQQKQPVAEPKHSKRGN